MVARTTHKLSGKPGSRLRDAAKRRAFAARLLRRNSAVRLSHERVGRRDAAIAWLPLIWRRPLRQIVSPQPATSVVRWHLSLRHQSTRLLQNVTYPVVRETRRIAGETKRVFAAPSTPATAPRHVAAGATVGPMPNRQYAPSGRTIRVSVHRRTVWLPRPISHAGAGAAAIIHRIRTRSTIRVQGTWSVPGLRTQSRQQPGARHHAEFLFGISEPGRPAKAPNTVSLRAPAEHRPGRPVIVRPQSQVPFRDHPRRAGFRDRPARVSIVRVPRPAAAQFRPVRTVGVEAHTLMAAERAELARRLVNGSPGTRPRLSARSATVPAARQTFAASQAQIVAAGYAFGSSQTSRTQLTHVIQNRRQTNTEIDRNLLEQNVIQSVSRNVSETLSRTVNETVRRQLAANSRTRNALIDQLGSDLYDQVVLERERIG